MEAGYSEKVDELCDRYSLKGFVKAKGIILCQSLPFSKQFFLLSICQWCTEAEASIPQIRYLHLDELAIDDIVWVDEPVGLQEATCLIEGCKVIGLDCEWKPNYEKGSKINKVINVSPLFHRKQ